MSALNPDEATAQRLAGMAQSPAYGRDTDPETGDGTLVDDPAVRPPLVLGDRDFHSVTETICGWTENKPGAWWWWAFVISTGAMTFGLVMIAYLFITGVGVWGLSNPVGWGWAIVNFVWWVGIGHAGTLISAILAIFKQKWRTSINRFAEAMTIFAVICAGLFPGIHVGRWWFAWFLAPVPWYNQVWPNFRSPLLWDAFAVGTYFTISLLFWYMGMIPDLATLRDRAHRRFNQAQEALGRVQWIVQRLGLFVYGFLSLGWRFSHRHWRNYEKAYILLAGIATPLVLSVHSVVSFDFAVSIIPGWHTTIFPPYFVAGAIFSGFAMVLTLLVPSRELYPGMKDFVTMRTLENMCKITLVTGMMVAFGYSMEWFIAWYGASQYEFQAFMLRGTGPYAWSWMIMVFCNVLVPQAFWFKWARTTPWFIFIVSILINIGMWFERFVIVITSLAADYLPSSWDYYTPTFVDVMTFVGSLGIFMTLFLLFMRFLPMMAMAEIKNVMPQADPHADEHEDRSGSEGGA